MEPDKLVVSWLALDALRPAAWQALAQLLSPEERQQAAQFHFEQDRQAYIAAHALLRGTLSRFLPGRKPADWRFAPGPWGKPALTGAADAGTLAFNLSHTRGMVAVALAPDGEVGVDVERLNRGNLTLELAARFFAPAECAALADIAEERQAEAFIAFWTLKESYIKAVGKGLSLPLDAFAFRLDPPTISFDDRIEDRAEEWLFRSLRPTTGYALASAWRHPRLSEVAVEAGPADIEAILRFAT